MAKKVTLRKRCGNPNCKDPRCDYVIVEKNETLWERLRNYNPVFHPMLVIGIILFLLFHLPMGILFITDFIVALGG